MKKRVNTLQLVVLSAPLLLFFFSTPVQATNYDHEIKLRKMSFSWKIDKQRILIKLTAMTEGWVGIGFNPTRRMRDANFILGYVKGGNVMITDAFGVRAREHISDTSINGRNNVTSISGNERGGVTTIEFAIPLDSKDSADKKLTVNGFTTVLLAFGKGGDNFYSRHRFRSSLKVNLSTGNYR